MTIVDLWQWLESKIFLVCWSKSFWRAYFTFPTHLAKHYKTFYIFATHKITQHDKIRLCPKLSKVLHIIKNMQQFRKIWLKSIFSKIFWHLVNGEMIFLFKREIERKFLKKKGEEYQRKKIFRLNLYLDLNIHISILWLTYL